MPRTSTPCSRATSARPTVAAPAPKMAARAKGRIVNLSSMVAQGREVRGGTEPGEAGQTLHDGHARLEAKSRPLTGRRGWSDPRVPRRSTLTRVYVMLATGG